MTSLPWWCPSQGLPLWHSRAGEDVFGSTETKGLACWVGLLLRHFWRCCADPWPFLTAPHYFHSEKVSSQQDQTQLPTRGTCREMWNKVPLICWSQISKYQSELLKPGWKNACSCFCPAMALHTRGSSEQWYRSSSSGAESWNHSRTQQRGAVFYAFVIESLHLRDKVKTKTCIQVTHSGYKTIIKTQYLILSNWHLHDLGAWNEGLEQ